MKIIIVLFIILGLWAITSLFMDSDIESPSYSVLSSENNFELRSYDPYIIAEVSVDASSPRPSSAAFRELGGYIFGGNEGDVSISMTSPVAIEKRSGQNIAMTAPVATTLDNERYTMSFSMPSKFTLENLPKPNSDRISFRQLPAGLYATLRFSGWATDAREKKYTKKLIQKIEEQSLEQIAAAELLQYDRPTKFPFLKRNEIRIQVKK